MHFSLCVCSVCHMCVHVCKCMCMCVRGLRLTSGIFQSLSILLLLHQFMDSALLLQRVWQSEDGSHCGFQGENSGHPTRRQMPLPTAQPDRLSTVVFDLGLSLNVELADLARLTCWGAPGCPAPASLALDFRSCCCMDLHTGNPNSGPYVCIANTSPPEPFRSPSS